MNVLYLVCGAFHNFVSIEMCEGFRLVQVMNVSCKFSNEQNENHVISRLLLWTFTNF